MYHGLRKFSSLALALALAEMWAAGGEKQVRDRDAALQRALRLIGQDASCYIFHEDVVNGGVIAIPKVTPKCSGAYALRTCGRAQETIGGVCWKWIAETPEELSTEQRAQIRSAWHLFMDVFEGEACRASHNNDLTPAFQECYVAGLEDCEMFASGIRAAKKISVMEYADHLVIAITLESPAAKCRDMPVYKPREDAFLMAVGTLEIVLPPVAVWKQRD